MEIIQKNATLLVNSQRGIFLSSVGKWDFNQWAVFAIAYDKIALTQNIVVFA